MRILAAYQELFNRSQQIPNFCSCYLDWEWHVYLINHLFLFFPLRDGALNRQRQRPSPLPHTNGLSSHRRWQKQISQQIHAPCMCYKAYALVSSSKGGREHPETTDNCRQEPSETQEIEVTQQQLMAGTPKETQVKHLLPPTTQWGDPLVKMSITGDANNLESQLWDLQEAWEIMHCSSNTKHRNDSHFLESNLG